MEGNFLPSCSRHRRSGIVYEASLCHVDIDDSHGEERMFSFWYIPALGRCKYAAIIPETVEYIQ